MFGLMLLASWLVLVVLIFALPNDRLRKVIGWVLPLAGLVVMAILAHHLAPWQRLVLAALVMLYLLKGTILLRYSRQALAEFSKTGLLIYLTLWPGMNPEPFRQRQPDVPEDGTRFVRGYLFMVTGMVIVFSTAMWLPQNGWLGILGLLLTIHCGYSDILSCLLRLSGWPVTPLFNQPFASRSLHDFWSRRWNIAFVEMDNILFFRPFKKVLGMTGAIIGVFAISGVLHEMALSYPALGGWGLPMAYFLLQGVVVAIERKALRPEKRWPPLRGRLWTWLWLLAPVMLVFHASFQDMLILPLFGLLHQLLAPVTLEWALDKALWLAGIGHFCILFASYQVPKKLNWKEDLAKLAPFNRKIMWNYGGFIVMLIIFYGCLTLSLHAELLRGDRAALGLAGLIGTFWLARVIVDFTYFKHEDWPQGPIFVIGHVMLTSLFTGLVLTYWGLIFWHSLT